MGSGIVWQDDTTSLTIQRWWRACADGFRQAQAVAGARDANLYKRLLIEFGQNVVVDRVFVELARMVAKTELR